MLQMKGYAIVEKIYHGATTEAYRAVRLEDNKKVILKSTASDHPTTKELATLQHEYSLLKKLDLSGVVRAEGLITHENTTILVLEDIQGITLAQFLNSRPVDLTLFFRIAKQLIQIVASLHQHHIIHKDINPHNIIIEPHSLVTKLIDLSISTEIFEKVETQLSPYTLEGNIAYVSPEQTGRMNRSLDYRTDFYSLGVTFFQMLTGALPFQASDPVEWVHCHIAKIPPLATSINPNIPEMVSLIIGKLLEKIPEDRYSSTTSLQLDINECSQQWERKKSIDIFSLRQRISSGQLYISQKLYGRDDQVESLLGAFERTTRGVSELLLVSGYSGIGKTSLIQEVHKPIVRQHGYFISGKFDQLKRSIPYSAIIQACQSLIKQLLTEPDARLIALKQEIIAVLGINGNIIINILPELELIIGPQPPVVELQPSEAQNRFTMVFEDFFRIFTKADHPLVMFLDDLQWADNASLLLIEHILTDVKSHYLLVIGAYRDTEVKGDHILMKMQQNIMEVGIATQTIQLSNLTLTDVEHLVADTLHQDILRIQPLVKLIYSKTHGNPFFITQILKVLYQEELLVFSHELNTWQWDIKKIESLAVTDNVIDLTIARLQKLPIVAQENLKLASCIGSQFDLQTLSIVSQQSLKELALSFIPALTEGLIKNLGTTYRQADLNNSEKDGTVEKIEYQFIHDRVQQAAYDLMSEGVRKQTHLYIARLLLKDANIETNEQKIFEILQHYNKSLDLITDKDEKLQVARLNLIAAQNAKRSIAYQFALSYITAGIDLLTEADWETDYQLLFNLYRERSECAYLVGQHEDAEKYFDILLNHAKTNLEKADIYTIKVILYANRHQHEKSLETGINALELLGIKLPRHPNSFHVIKEILYITAKLFFVDVANLYKTLKEAHNPETIVSSHILMEMGPAAYIANPKFLALMASKRIVINLKDGYCRYSITAYMTYALIIMTRFQHYNKTFEFVTLAGKLADKSNHLPTLSRYYATLVLWFAHWRYPYAECIHLARKSYQLAFDAGDVLFAGYSQMVLTALQFLTAMPLAELLKAIDVMNETLHRIQDVGFYQFGLLFKTTVLYWQGQTNLTMEEIRQLILSSEKNESQTVAMMTHEIFSNLAFTFGHYDLALQSIIKAFSLRPYVLGLVWNQELYMLYALILARKYKEVSAKEQKSYRKTYKSLLKQVKIWNKQCPQNMEYKYLLMQAEWERINGNMTKAAELFDLAIVSTQEGGFTQFIALTNELAAFFYLELGKTKFAKIYMVEAHYNYLRWGAIAKAKQIEQAYPDWFIVQKQALELSVDTVSSSTLNPVLLDFISVLKATQAISSEIVLDNLLRQMIYIVLENAGAERGLIILENTDTLVVAAEGYANNKDVKLLQNVPLNERNDLPTKLIAYVKNSHEEVVISNASADGRFMGDPYIMTKQPKSILCIPIMKQKNLIGILYLENNLVEDAFKKELLQVLNLLATQAAISLENARLYSASEHFVPRAFLQQLNKTSLVNVKIGDSVYCERSIMFCDIRGFTRFSEGITPNEVFQFVNKFFAEMEPIIGQYRGFIDKYIGDAIMALFENPDSAIQAAIAMKLQLVKFNKQLQAAGALTIDIGIGINTGELILGIIGNATRMEGTVIGHAVNTASRIEDLTKQYKVSLLITEDTEKKLMYPQHYALRLIDNVIVRGQSSAIGIFEVCAVDSPVVRNHKINCIETFNDARQFYIEKNYSKALELFQSCLKPDILDTVVNLYIEKCRAALLDPSDEKKIITH
ncbi:MAG: AAA family ATPase [Gammaproteobacteria bacterium]|nr:AAA family ATPase [Gammaproteobacteria bacterium]